MVSLFCGLLSADCELSAMELSCFSEPASDDGLSAELFCGSDSFDKTDEVSVFEVSVFELVPELSDAPQAVSMSIDEASIVKRSFLSFIVFLLVSAGQTKCFADMISLVYHTTVPVRLQILISYRYLCFSVILYPGEQQAVRSLFL